MRTSTRIKRLFTHDWEAKIIALVLALLLWYIVNDQIDRNRYKMPEGWPMRTPTSAS